MGKNVVVIGSTGSIGRSTLDVIRNNGRRFSVRGLCCHGSVDALIGQIEEFSPEFVSLYSPESLDRLKFEVKKRKLGVKIYCGDEGNVRAASSGAADIVVISVVGGIGLAPTLAAVSAGKKVCLANKEALVCGGCLVMAEARKSGAKIIPIDSEHSAIFQLLEKVPRRDLKKIIITASGGPFRNYDEKALAKVKVEEALRHPNWSMGAKITIDSATLMNKGLEVIEAMWLFDMPAEKIEVVVHPQSVIHSMIELRDGAVLAHMGRADMRIPISYALSHPGRIPVGCVEPFDFEKFSKLTFEKPDLANFPSLSYAYEAAAAGGTMPAAMNAANEAAVNGFLTGQIRFVDIASVVRAVMDDHAGRTVRSPRFADIAAAGASARAAAEKICAKISKEAARK